MAQTSYFWWRTAFATFFGCDCLRWQLPSCQFHIFCYSQQPCGHPSHGRLDLQGSNLLQSWRLFMERQPVKLTAEEAEVRRLVFQDLPPRKVLHVLSIGSWVTAESGERLMESGVVPDAVSLIVSGKVRLTKDGQFIGVLGAGQIVGSTLILSGLQSDVEAVVESPVRAIRWQVDTLERYLNANPDTRTHTAPPALTLNPPNSG